MTDFPHQEGRVIRTRSHEPANGFMERTKQHHLDLPPEVRMLALRVPVIVHLAQKAEERRKGTMEEDSTNLVILAEAPIFYEKSPSKRPV
ncbi:MAG: hypothetical protein ACD_78C00041G0001 [uncultured bacterium (gcode 4)]|uniref:Uncharacterized protein n=1 Tax=uncultured bacterium (gcode 4) TaxID=1234023 RepID=K1XZ89_9BACT|nr:MAG: hypothetical protein ACD_78C00041G0001 [uncultured bacterium (gcode 4)]